MLRVVNILGDGLLLLIRRNFGMSQTDLALFLGISPVQLAQAETAVRRLPVKAILPQVVLAAAAEFTPAPPEPLDRAPLEQRLRACEYEMRQLRPRLESCQQRAEIARRRLAALSALQQSPTPDLPWTEDQQRWLQRFERQARAALPECGTTAQALLAARLAALEHEAALLTQLLAELP